MNDLTKKKCVPCEGGVTALKKSDAEELLLHLPKWHFNENHTGINRKFTFKNFYQTIAFVNAVAWIANKENHHPDMKVSYGYCSVQFTTHAIQGLSENDFICAAKIDQLEK